MQPVMHLRVMLPFAVFIDATDVIGIVIDTTAGAHGLLPHRQDCAAALNTGILRYTSKSTTEIFIAIDRGVMIKTGPEVLVSVRRAIAGDNVGQLRAMIEQQFLAQDAQERTLRRVMAGMDARFVLGMARYQHG